jgi:hypothetical protein
MAKAGAPIGNQNGAKGKEWFDALRKVCVQKDALRKIAEVVVAKAEAGEQWAVQEVANRFDGKPAQSVEVSGADGGPLLTAIKVQLVDPKPANAE